MVCPIMPGFREWVLPRFDGLPGGYILKERWAADGFTDYDLITTPAAPHIWIPKPVELVGMAAAALIVKNPVVTRRFWQGWVA